MEKIITSLLLSLVLASTAMAQDLEIDASISGYNLLWPTTRCCSFELHINTAGLATISGRVHSEKRPAEFNKKMQLTSTQLADIKRAIADSDFYHLPSEVCCFAVDGDERRITIKEGKRSHDILIGDSAPIGASHELQLQRQRANLLWSVLTSIAEIPGYNIGQEPPNNAFKADEAEATRP